MDLYIYIYKINSGHLVSTGSKHQTAIFFLTKLSCKNLIRQLEGENVFKKKVNYVYNSKIIFR